MSDVAYDPLRYRQAGADWVKGLYSDVTNRQAGRALGQGNYAQAAQTLFNAGDLNGGQAVQNLQIQRQQQQLATDEVSRRKQLEFTLQAANSLRTTRQQGGDVLAAYDQMTPVFLQMGTTPDQVQQLRGSLAQNPDQFLDTVLSGVQRELEVVNLGNGYAQAIDKGTGEVVNTYQAPEKPQRVVVGNDYIEVGPDGVRPLYQGARQPEYRTIRDSNGVESIVEVGGRPSGVISGAGGSGGFTDRSQVLDFIAPIVGDFRPTSGARSREEQDALIARGATSAYNSAHVGGLGQDIVPNAPRDQWERIAQDLRATGRFGRVLVESGNGRNQGTGAHIHLEPLVGSGGASAPAQSGGVRVVAQGQNNGPTPAEARQQSREERADLASQGQLRREFNGRQEVKDFRTIEAAYNTLQSAFRNPSAAGDLSGIFAYMKLLDPTSVVREQEFANAQNAAGVPDQVRNAYNRALRGERLNPRQRQDFQNQAQGLYQTRRQTYDRLSQEYRTEAELSGFDPNRIVPPRSDQQRSGRSRQTNAPGVPFNLNTAQLSSRNAFIQSGMADHTARLGSQANPHYIDEAFPSRSFNNYRRRAQETKTRQYYFSTDGRLSYIDP